MFHRQCYSFVNPFSHFMETKRKENNMSNGQRLLSKKEQMFLNNKKLLVKRWLEGCLFLRAIFSPIFPFSLLSFDPKMLSRSVFHPLKSLKETRGRSQSSFIPTEIKAGKDSLGNFDAYHVLFLFSSCSLIPKNFLFQLLILLFIPLLPLVILCHSLHLFLLLI